MELAEAKKQVIKAGIELSRSGLIARTWGNVSSRIDKEHFVITASGRNYLTLTEEEVIRVDLDNLKYEGNIKPSSEKKVHREVYRLRPDASFVIHTHQSNASAVAAMGLEEIKLDKAYPGLGKRVLCAGYGMPGTKKLCKNTAEAIAAYDGQAVIMSNHGALCYGSCYEEAFQVAHMLEEACGKYLEDMGIPAWQAGTSPSKATASKTEALEPIWNDSPAIMKFLEVRRVLKPYLDDFAQLVGASMKVIENDAEAIENAIKNNRPVLVKGRGALCVAEEKGDEEALSIVIEKNCRAALAAIGSKPINPVECALMRAFYLKKYSKQSK